MEITFDPKTQTHLGRLRFWPNEGGLTVYLAFACEGPPYKIGSDSYIYNSEPLGKFTNWGKTVSFAPNRNAQLTKLNLFWINKLRPIINQYGWDIQDNEWIMLPVGTDDPIQLPLF